MNVRDVLERIGETGGVLFMVVFAIGVVNTVRGIVRGYRRGELGPRVVGGAARAVEPPPPKPGAPRMGVKIARVPDSLLRAIEEQKEEEQKKITGPRSSSRASPKPEPPVER